jgi:TPR repeat protein
MRLKTFALVLFWICGLAATAREREKPGSLCPRTPGAFAKVQAKAAAGYPPAQVAVASCYELGRNVSASRAETIHWLLLAADRGYAPAQSELGRIYLYGRGVAADYSQALLWETRAAEQGEARAQRDLAYMYEKGLGVTADLAQAADYNRKAASQGLAEAQLRLGQALETGTGLRRDPAEAMRWYAKAAEQDLPAAQLHLARLNAQSESCAAAISWYKRAAGHGEVQAMYELGRLYLTKPCGASPAQAFLWLYLSGRYGLEEGRREAAELGPGLATGQRKKSELLAENWIHKHTGAREEENDERGQDRQ